jgi:hypothetical protein
MKQQAIQEAYGEHWETMKDYVDQNGWFIYDFYNKNKSNHYEIAFDIVCENIDSIGDFDLKHIRPKSLEGIENNNGWIRIESEQDLPKEGTLEFKVGAMVSNKFHLSRGVYDYNEVNFSFQNKYITHYQIIPKPKLPIF